MLSMGKIKAYRSKVECLNCGNLFWILPANESTACKKTVFKVSFNAENNKYKFSPTDKTREPFFTDGSYFDTKAIPFDACIIHPMGFSSIFCSKTALEFKLGNSDTPEDRAKVMMKYRKMETNYDTIYEDKDALKTNEIKQKGSTTMSKIVNRAKDTNMEAVRVTARLASGRALNTILVEKVVPKLPLMVRGYADTTLGRVALANIVAAALTYYAPNNNKATLVSDAIVQAAMVDLMSEINIEDMIKTFLNSDAATSILEGVDNVEI